MIPELSMLCIPHPFRLRLATLVALVILGAAFLSAPAATAQTANNPCSLLTGAEVEGVLGEPLAGPPFRAYNDFLPAAEGDYCRYVTPSFRAITVYVDWSNGGSAFGITNTVSGIADMPGLAELGLGDALGIVEGTPLRGAWDEARQFMCCEFSALLGDQRVMIDISGSSATIEQAASLADLAVQRLGAPLEVAADQGLAEAAAHDATRPAFASACDLIPRDVAEKILGVPLAQEPEGDQYECLYVWTPAGADYQEGIELQVMPRNGFAEFRQSQDGIDASLGMLAEEGLATETETGTDGTVFDAYHASIIGVMAVRRDVSLTIESGPFTEIADKFLLAAARNL
jgi:hypothetical protein